MCGRYVSVRSDADLLREFDAVMLAERNLDGLPGPDYNIAPTDPVRGIVNRPLRGEDGKPTGAAVRQLRPMAWGLVPSWSADRKGAARMINARSETVAGARAFSKAYAKRRCLIPADGWYEWRVGESGTKQPYYMTRTDGRVLAFAGLYEFWGQPGETITTCTIITVAAVDELVEVHDRMPLVLPPASWPRWLDPAVTDPADLIAQPARRPDHLELRPVGRAVGDVRNDGPQLIERADPAPEAQALF